MRWAVIGVLLVGCELVFPLDGEGADSPPFAFIQAHEREIPDAVPRIDVTYGTAQHEGGLNIVFVTWDNDTTVDAVHDTSGNTYEPAVIGSGDPRPQGLYFATNIHATGAGQNAVTVDFADDATIPNLRILEYGGISREAPLDIAIAMAGLSDTAIAELTTVHDHDLLVAASSLCGLPPDGNGAGPDFAERLHSPVGIVEDREVTEPGLYTATAPIVEDNKCWVMTFAAFRIVGD